MDEHKLKPNLKNVTALHVEVCVYVSHLDGSCWEYPHRLFEDHVHVGKLGEVLEGDIAIGIVSEGVAYLLPRLLLLVFVHPHQKDEGSQLTIGRVEALVKIIR